MNDKLSLSPNSMLIKQDIGKYISCTHGNRYTLPSHVKEIRITYIEFKCGCIIKIHDGWIEYTEI